MATPDRTVLITGATGKLGRMFASGFAGLGWNVVFTTRGGHAGPRLEKEWRERGAARVLRIEADLTHPDAVERVVAMATAQDLLPDTLVNNARNSAFLEIGADGRTATANWHGEYTLGVVLPYALTMALADAPNTRLARVINVASMYGVMAANLTLYDKPERESPVNYGVTKAALIHLTKELAVRLARRGISVNAVSYGGVAGRVNADFKQRYERLVPSGRMLEDADVFGAMRFLASDDAKGMTGHNLVVDGGWTIW